MMNKIPIKNIWWLMLYASDLRVKGIQKFAKEDNLDDLSNLIAKILIRAVKRRLLRNLSVELESKQDDLTRIRGRINHIRTERRQLLKKGKIACVYDHFTTNTPKNQYVKAALDKLGKITQDKKLKQSCRVYSRVLESIGVVQNIHITHKKFTKTSIEDREMLAAAQLALNMRLPTEEMGRSYLAVTSKDETWLRRLFEKGVGGFYKTTLSGVELGKQIKWPQESPTLEIQDILPNMQTDIIINNKTRIIIDTKFTEILATNQHGDERLKSGHIFQLYSYLRSQEREDDPQSMKSSGMLLYPSIGTDINESVVIQGHKIRFATVNLAADSKDIRNRLLELVE